MDARTMTRRMLAGTALAALLLTGCSGDDSSDGSATTTTEATTSSETSTEAPSSESTDGTTSPETEPPATEPASTPTPAGVGCTGGENGPGTPPGIASGQVVDIDQDGEAESAFIAMYDGTRAVFGVRFSTSNAVITTEINPSAGPSSLIALPADVDGDGRFELIAGSRRGTELFAFEGCEIVPIAGEDGDQYRFDHVTDAPGTGVGCVDGDLVGLDQTQVSDAEVEWSRTVVEIDGTTARNGEVETGTYTRPEDDAAIDLLGDTTCGDLTIQANGVELVR